VALEQERVEPATCLLHCNHQRQAGDGRHSARRLHKVVEELPIEVLSVLRRRRLVGADEKVVLAERAATLCVLKDPPSICAAAAAASHRHSTCLVPRFDAIEQASADGIHPGRAHVPHSRRRLPPTTRRNALRPTRRTSPARPTR